MTMYQISSYGYLVEQDDQVVEYISDNIQTWRPYDRVHFCMVVVIMTSKYDVMSTWWKGNSQVTVYVLDDLPTSLYDCSFNNQ